MKIKVIQADTRPVQVYTESRNLTYGPPNQMHLGLIASLNNNILIQPNDAISLGRILNLLKCRLMSVSYENIMGNVDDWEKEGKKAHCWIKIHSIIQRMKDPANSDIRVFCALDSDAWIRDENAFLEFCNRFVDSEYSFAIPRDIELETSSFFNAGVFFVKNNKTGLEILESIYNNEEYRCWDKKSWHEGSALSCYYEKHPKDFMVLPLNDFNTPCGRIVRHCWIKHLTEPMVIEEVLASMMKLTLGFTNDPNYNIGKNVNLIAPS